MNEAGKFSILVVDDEKSNIIALMDILKPEYIVYAARNGQSAIEMAEKHNPDIILLDIIMPEMDGYEVIAALKSSEKTKNIPVIFVTGLSGTGDEEKGFALGAADYIIKPFSPALVKLRVAGAMIDIIEKKWMAKMLKQREIMLSAVNRAASVLLTAEDNGTFRDSLLEGMEIIGNSVDADCVEVWQNEMRDGELNAILKHYWFSETGRKIKSDNPISSFPYSAVPIWEKRLALGENIQGPVSSLSQEEQDFLSSFKIKTVLVMPTFIQNKFWGFCCIDDCRNTRNFTEDEIDILRSGSYMLANAINRHKMIKDIEYRDSLLRAVNHATANLLNSDLDSFEHALYQSMKTLAEAVAVDRVRIWKNHTTDGNLYCTQLYEWSETAEPQQGKEITINLSYSEKLPGWKEVLSKGNCVNVFTRNSQKELQEHLSPQGILSILVVPVFVEDKFWGHVGFDECKCERIFTEEEESILLSCSRLFAEAMLRNEMIINIRDTSVKLKAAMEKAIEDEERMHVMLDTLPLACSLISRDHKFISMNKASMELFEVPYSESIAAEEITKMYFNMLPEFQPNGRRSLELTYEYIEKAFEEGYLRFEWIYRKPNGEKIPCEDTLIRVRYKGEYILAGYIRDLREEKAIIEEMRKAEIAEESNKAKSQFLANMSHEMRTPMNVVVGLTDLMLEENDLAPHLKENLKKISTAGNTLLGLINDVLDISKIEAGRLELVSVQYEVPSLLNDIITLNMIRIEEKPVKFLLDIDENLLHKLFGDDLRVKQIINNLLGNAIKYTQEGTVTLGMTTEQKDNYVLVSVYVSDTGIGIREDDLNKLFTNYGQVDTRTNRTIEGTGLGLAITKQLAEMMGGEIGAESKYGKGSVFRVRFRQGFVDSTSIGPLVSKNLREFLYAENKQTGKKKIVRPDLSYARVLVVDDMQTNLDVAAGLLGKYKMQVDCVLNGQDAIDRMRLSGGGTNGEPVYNAIFMDHMMPGMDGIETVKIIRSLDSEYAQKIPIIALTANAIQGTENLFYSNGFQAFLPKPINIMQLDSIIRKWIVGKNT